MKELPRNDRWILTLALMCCWLVLKACLWRLTFGQKEVPVGSEHRCDRTSEDCLYQSELVSD